jgi:hypothetical protein
MVPYAQHFIFFITYEWTQLTNVLHYTILERLAIDKQSNIWSIRKLRRKLSVVNTAPGF